MSVVSTNQIPGKTVSRQPGPRGRVPAGVATGGQFAASAHAEASGVTLGAPSGANGPGDDVAAARLRAAIETVDRLVARETIHGSMTEVDRSEDVEADLRADFPHLDEDTFGQRARAIGLLAEQISTVEAAEATDTESYEAEAEAVDLELGDFPAGDDWAPGDTHTDCEAFRSVVIETLDSRLRSEVQGLVEADARAAMTGSLVGGVERRSA